jgi:hypothetical protein
MAFLGNLNVIVKGVSIKITNKTLGTGNRPRERAEKSLT